MLTHIIHIREWEVNLDRVQLVLSNMHDGVYVLDSRDIRGYSMK